MSLPARQKFAGERRIVTFDFSTKLPVGDTLSGTATVTASAGLTVGAASSDLVNGLVNVPVSGGTVGNDYTVTCQHNTAGGEILIMAMIIEVRDDVN